MNIIFRADSNNKIGSGHLLRCFALAQKLKKRNATITFISYCDNNEMKKKIIDEGFKLISIDNTHPHPIDISKTISIIRQDKSINKWLVLDGYNFDTDFHKSIKNENIKLLVIDDNGHLDHYIADIILNQNIYSNKISYSCEPNTKLLLGSEYILLREEFINADNKEDKLDKITKNILITMGGSDSNNVTTKILKTFDKIKIDSIQLIIVLGPMNVYENNLKRIAKKSKQKVKILKNVSNIADIMAISDLAISSGGSSSWELAFMKIPMILVEIADNQKESVSWLKENDLAISLGRSKNISANNLSDAIKCSTDRDWLTNFKYKCTGLIDGLGSSRVSSIMSEIK